MKNVATILREMGYEVTEEQEKELLKQVATEYITRAEHDKKIERAEADRDQYKTQLDEANATIAKFDGIDPAKVKEDIAAWQQKAENAEKEYNQKLAARERRDLISKALDGYKFSSRAARDSIASKLEADEITVKDGHLMGFEDYIKAYRESDADAFAPDNQPASFTTPATGSTGNGQITKKDILAIKDPKERQRLIAENLNLFGH